MAKLNNREYTRQQLLRYAGNLSSVAGVTPIEYTQGKSRGVRAFEVRTGGGLEFTVTQDKCMDIHTLRYRGVTLSQQSKNSLTAPEYGQPIKGDFSSSVSGGMLFTSGLRNSGPDCVDTDGSYHPTHGRIGATPAENVCAEARWEGDEYVIEISGSMRESALFGHNLLLTRRISTKLGSNELHIHDTIDNLSPLPEEFCILYHFNYGFPFLSEDLRLTFPENRLVPRTPQAAAGADEAEKIIAPEDDFFEHVFFREDMAADDDGWCTVLAENPVLGIGSYISYEKKNLPLLMEWKSMLSGDYSLGIEPANMYIMGRKEERENGTLPIIPGFGRIEFNLKVGAFDL